MKTLTLALLLILLPSLAVAATGTIMPSPYQLVLDSNGNPVSGGCVWTYAAGTSTPATTYTDVGLSVANANPIIANSSGRFTAFLTPGSSYKFVYENTPCSAISHGSTLVTADNIAATPISAASVDVVGTAGEALTAGQCVYLSDGSGSKTAGQWFKCDSANTYSSVLPMVGLVPASVSSGSAGTIRISGSVPGLSSLSPGTSYYVGTAGAITATAPALRRALGIADSATSIILTPTSAITAPWSVVTTTSTGTQNDFAPGLIGNTIIRCNNASLLTITGIAGGYDGQRIIVQSIGAGQVDLPHQSTSSTTAADRFINFATVGTTSLAAGVGAAEYTYDGTTARWRLTAHEQGAWITRTFAAGNYTASAGTWTVASATRDAFYLKGRTLSFSVSASGTTSGTPVSVKVTLPNSYSGAANDIIASYTSNNGAAAAEAGYAQPSTTTLNFQRLGNATFSAGTVGVNAVAVFEVQ